MLSGCGSTIRSNEIVTYGQGYALNKGIKTFVQSAKKHHERVTVIGLDLSPEVLIYLFENKVAYIDAREIAKKYNVDLSVSPYTLKVIFFYLYVKHYADAEEYFLCDFTDIYFQGNIFRLQELHTATVFGEGEKIGNCPTNSTWIKVCYNDDILNLLRNKEIINGGAILGTSQQCINLLKEMCLESSLIIGRIGNYRNIDQAILNKVVRFDEHNYRVANYLDVLNMAHMDKQVNLFFDKGGVHIHLVNEYEQTVYPAVIHQYDVNKVLEAHIYGKI